MNVRSGMEALNSLFGVAQTPATTPGQVRNGSATGSSAVGNDTATLSSMASQAADSSAAADVRLDKVATIQAALAAGTYNVPASAVSSRMVDSMLGYGA